MSAKKRKKSSFGRYICALGLLIKVIQLISTSLGVSEMGNTVWTAIFVCLTAGGLFIVALEWRGATSIFSAACALGVMLSLISTQNTVILNCILYFWLISYALMLFSMGGKRRLCSLGVFLCIVLLLLCAGHVISLTKLLGTVLLCFMYTLMGIGISV